MKIRIYYCVDERLWLVVWDGLEYATVSWIRAVQFAQVWHRADTAMRKAA